MLNIGDLDRNSPVDQLQKRRTRRTRPLQAEGILTVSEGRELAQEAEEAVNPPCSQ
ncbi:hypothetical protein TSTA_048970 [Talaromyces stipitatus ATCC 10500]|uniref:Uncharacterized protein n=1 Tax=Talaromyces stipitatus (strain ATCC 10500 / CBS 375.48 / QM 6759 / NRRL 1006) TaxID=441959 RepID=B8ML41_TALSN|nr:uncharacterized protein TSTA_048970 [Talaromyces stipitatus ATCC 10500]EED15457.1 hypothetical protein TSTA_048970 [Talaromyces stipitatus ATCC 10500]